MSIVYIPFLHSRMLFFHLCSIFICVSFLRFSFRFSFFFNNFFRGWGIADVSCRHQVRCVSHVRHDKTTLSSVFNRFARSST